MGLHVFLVYSQQTDKGYVLFITDYRSEAD
jgi:hypothetical protein